MTSTLKRSPMARTKPLTTPKAVTPPKPRKCKAPGCKGLFESSQPFRTWCSPACGLAIAQAKLAKQAKEAKKIERAADQVKRETLKTRSDWIKDAQKAFNAFIRARDLGRPCICCGQPLGDQQFGGSFDAGHYRSVGSAPHLRFEENNVHAQRKQCNQHGGGRAVDYRVGLIRRIGLEAVEALEADQAPRRHTVDELRQITATYRQKTRDIEKAREAATA